MTAFLGTSEKFPFQPDANGNVALVSDIESIRQSIDEILSTPIGTRFFNEYFGSMLHYLSFEPNDQILSGLTKYFTADALKKWEKRILVNDVNPIIETNVVQIYIPYTVLQTNATDTFIYPFYREITQ